MVSRLLVLFAVVAGFMATDALAAARCEKLIATGSADYPPFLWRDPANPRVLMGADADLLKQIGQELGLKIEILYSGSRAQAQEDVRTGRADLLIAARLTLAQLEQMDYINPPIRQTLTHRSEERRVGKECLPLLVGMICWAAQLSHPVIPP